MAKPFRWDISKREQLGSLITPDVEVYPRFVDAFRALCAGILGASADSTMVFVGRSPENCFDYLSGILGETSWCDRLISLNISNRDYSTKQLQLYYPDALYPLKAHFKALGLSPKDIIHAPRPITFVDLVCEGGTYDALYDFVYTWAKSSVDDMPAVLRKLRFVGITSRQKTSPNTFRWQQHAPWVKTLSKGAVQNISIPRRLWSEMGNLQPKISQWNPPWRWGDTSMRHPPRQQDNMEALSLALYLYDLGSQRHERQMLRALMSQQHAIKHRWFRALMSELA